MRTMGGRRKHERGDLPLTADINVTSLVDVAFTLLVIFIITAPALQGGVEVEIPRADVQAITAQDDPFYVTIDADDQIYVAETPVSRQEFEEGFGQLVAAAQPEIVYIQGDSLATYGVTLRVIAAVVRAGQEHGFKYALVGEPLPREGR